MFAAKRKGPQQRDLPFPILWVLGGRGQVVPTDGREEAAAVEVLQNQLLDALPEREAKAAAEPQSSLCCATTQGKGAVRHWHPKHSFTGTYNTIQFSEKLARTPVSAKPKPNCCS